MKKSIASKILLAVLVLALLVSVLPMAAFAAEGEYVFNPADLGERAPEDITADSAEPAGDDNYFTIHWGHADKRKVDTSTKKFTETVDGEEVVYQPGLRLNFQGKTVFTDTAIENAIEFTTEGPADVKIYWQQGGDVGSSRDVAIFNRAGEVLAQSNDTSDKNDAVITTLAVAEAGTYYIGNLVNNNPIFGIVVTEKAGEASAPTQMAWVKVTDASTLKAGDQLIMAAADGSAVNGNIADGKTILSSIPATDLPNMPEGAYALTLGGEAGAWTLASAEGALLAVTKASNGKLAWGGDNTTWTIAIDAEGLATIESTWADGRPEQIRCNQNANQERFANYAPSTSCGLPVLYRWEAVAAEPTPPTGDATPIFFLAAMAVIAMGGMLVLRKQKTW